jgi:hypothetical protein
MDEPEVLDVLVPPGISAGGTVEFAGPDGTLLQAIVPDGLSGGDTFQVTVDSSGNVTLYQLAEAMQGKSGVMEIFVAWFEREGVGEAIDAFVRDNEHRIDAIDGAAGEQSHDWWPLYQQYQAQFEALLQHFLDEAGCSQTEFLEEAQRAEGMNEVYVQLFLAHSEYEMFVEQMTQAARERRAREE